MNTDYIRYLKKGSTEDSGNSQRQKLITIKNETQRRRWAVHLQMLEREGIKGLCPPQQACKSQQLTQDSLASSRSYPCYPYTSSQCQYQQYQGTFQLQPHRHHMHFGSRLCGDTHSPCTPKQMQLGPDLQYTRSEEHTSELQSPC